MSYSVIRVGLANDGVFGVFWGPGGPYFVTLEPTLDDTFLQSVIPPGEYDAVPSFYHKGGYKTFEIKPVPGHSRILFHIGNTEADSLGCVLLGMEYGTLGGKKAILRSREAFERFMALVPGDGFKVRFV